MTSEVFSNSPVPGRVAPVAQLSGNGGQISSGATSVIVANALPSALQSGGQFHALIDQELVVIPCQSGVTLTGLTRGVEGSTAAVHLDGAEVYPLLTAGAIANALAGAVGTETSRAEGAEATNATAISGETTRAEAAEGLAALKANNLSDIADPGSARLNLHVAALAVCQAAATSNITLSGLQTIDGYTTLAGDLVLCTGQSTASQNGPWLAASGAWTRPHEYASAASIMAGRTVSVVGGAANRGPWVLATAGTVVVDTTATTWKSDASPSVVNGVAVHIAPLASGDATGVTDRTNLLAAIAAVPSGDKLLIPNPSRNGQSKYMVDQAVVFPQHITVEGESLVELWASGASGTTNTNGPGTGVTSGAGCTVRAAAFSGVVIEQQTAATDGIQTPSAAATVHLKNIAVGFAASIVDSNTGTPFNFTPSTNYSGKPDDGAMGCRRENLIAFGHDGNHYGFLGVNPLQNTETHLRSYGGGGFSYACNSALSSYGNNESTHPYAFVYNPGTAHGYAFSSSSATFPGVLNLLTFIRPQAIAHNAVKTAGTQYDWHDGLGAAECQGITAVDADLENFALSRIGPNTVFIGTGTHYGPTSGRYIQSKQGWSSGAGAAGAVTTAANYAAGGYGALAALTTGSNATAVGQGAGGAVTTAGDFTALGTAAGAAVIDGNENTFVGASAGYLGNGTAGNATVHGAQNTFVGSQSGPASNNDRTSGTTVGYRALINGHYATAIGQKASAGAAGAVAIGADHTGAGAATATQDVIAIGTANHQVQLANNTTGAGSAALGANSPAVTNTAPYTWFKMMSSDGSTVYVPAWK